MVKTVILAAGAFPKREGLAWQTLVSAGRVVACDGAANAYRRHFRKWPDVVIGDLDSIGKNCPVAVKVADQETNDLTKAIGFCRAKGWNDLVIVGATGLREDHAIGNVFRALDAQVPVITDCGVFHPVCGKARFRAKKGTPVSVFAPDPKTRMTSQGLAWKLDDIRFDNLYVATLNRTSATAFSVTSTRPVFVYIANMV